MQNNHSNNLNPLQLPQSLLEALNFKDLDGLMKPTIHVDEFASKMGDDDDIIVISFFLRDEMAAKDLMNWFEKGYDFVIDADKSPGEIKPNRYLVYIEIRRRSTAPANVARLLDELNTLTEFNGDDWTMHYRGEEVPFTEEDFARLVPLSPKEYRAKFESDLNEVRAAAGLKTKQIYERDATMRALQAAAGF